MLIDNNNLVFHSGWNTDIGYTTLQKACLKEKILIENNTNNNMKISFIEKLLLSKDTKQLKKAGILNGDLKLTVLGQEALLSILFKEKQSDLVKIAKDIIEEEKDNK